MIVSSNLVIDECMSAWKGSEKYECIFALPHKTKIMRKPQGIGAELKSLADGESGILLHLEFMEGNSASTVIQPLGSIPRNTSLGIAYMLF